MLAAAAAAAANKSSSCGWMNDQPKALNPVYKTAGITTDIYCKKLDILTRWWDCMQAGGMMILELPNDPNLWAFLYS
jgi:hypothetical protein